MKRRLRLPIRFKFMLTLLVVVTAVVGLITFSTAKLFQEDKQAYINDLTSMVAVGTAEEARSVMIGYRERLQVYARIMLAPAISEEEKARLLKSLFDDFPELVGVGFHRVGEPPAAIYNVAVLESAGLTRDAVRLYQEANPLPLERIRQTNDSFVRNSTINEQLPSFVLAFAEPTNEALSDTVVSALVHAGRLLQLASRFSAYEVSLLDTEGTILAHPEPERVVGRHPGEFRDEVVSLGGGFSAGTTREYTKDGAETIGGFADVDFAGMIAGAEIPKAAAFLTSRILVQRLLTVASVLLVISTLIGFFWALRITRPVESLSAATRKIAKGEFDIQVRSEVADEIGDLASSFNSMATELKTREEKLEEAQAQLIQSEKMAAFGQLGAGIAHEVKNPLAGILACAQLTMTEIEEGSQVHQDLKLIEKETKRCKAIIENLLRFARQEKTLLEPVQVNRAVQDAVAIVHHQLELNHVHLVSELDPTLPAIQGNTNQLQQVFMNMMINAQQAMEGEPGSIHVASRMSDSGQVEVVFRDTGPGIPAEIQQKLFEPFFTTKPGGKGTGLGLSVSFGIVRDHQGSIRIESVPGEGATFVITLPLAEALDESSAPEASADLVVTPAIPSGADPTRLDA